MRVRVGQRGAVFAVMSPPRVSVKQCKSVRLRSLLLRSAALAAAFPERLHRLNKHMRQQMSSTAADCRPSGWRGSESQHSRAGGAFPPATGGKRSGAVWEELLPLRWLLLACAVGVLTRKMEGNGEKWRETGHVAAAVSHWLTLASYSEIWGNIPDSAVTPTGAAAF